VSGSELGSAPARKTEREAGHFVSTSLAIGTTRVLV